MIFLLRKKYSVRLKVYKVLNSIYGLGSTKTEALITRLGATIHSTLFNIKRFRAVKLNRKLNQIKKTLIVFLRNKELAVHIDRITSGTYKGIRFQLGLPINGQRTKSNAKTMKRLNKNKGLNSKIKSKIAYSKKK